jgi:hypothetical protein
MFQDKFQDWIQIKYVDWDGLSSNPNAISLLELNTKKINWYCIGWYICKSCFYKKENKQHCHSCSKRTISMYIEAY